RFGLRALQFFHGFLGLQFLAGESGIIACVTIGAENWRSARRTGTSRSAGSGACTGSPGDRPLLHRLELLSLIRREQLRELCVHFLLNLLQLFLLLGGKLQRILLHGRQDLASLRTGGGNRSGTAWSRADGCEYAFELLFLGCVERLVKSFVNTLLQCGQFLLLSSRQLESIRFGACHDLAGPRPGTEAATAWRGP